MLNIKAMAGGVAVAALVGLAVGGWSGYRVASGSYEKQLHDLAVAYATAQTEAIDAANRAAATERARAVSAAEARGRKAASAREVIHEIQANPDDRDCGWTDDQRMRIEALYRAHGYRQDGAPTGVPDTLRTPATSEPAAGPVGSASLRLGRGVQGLAR